MNPASFDTNVSTGQYVSMCMPHDTMEELQKYLVDEASNKPNCGCNPKARMLHTMWPCLAVQAMCNIRVAKHEDKTE